MCTPVMCNASAWPNEMPSRLVSTCSIHSSVEHTHCVTTYFLSLFILITRWNTPKNTKDENNVSQKYH